MKLRASQLLFIAALCAVPSYLNAQTSGAADASSWVIKAEGLTVAQRDAIVRQTVAAGRYRVIFSCVPAGVLVLEPLRSGETDATTMQQACLSSVKKVAPTARQAAPNMGLVQAEALCLAARDQ